MLLAFALCPWACTSACAMSVLHNTILMGSSHYFRHFKPREHSPKDDCLSQGPEESWAQALCNVEIKARIWWMVSRVILDSGGWMQGQRMQDEGGPTPSGETARKQVGDSKVSERHQTLLFKHPNSTCPSPVQPSAGESLSWTAGPWCRRALPALSVEQATQLPRGDQAHFSFLGSCMLVVTKGPASRESACVLFCLVTYTSMKQARSVL